MRASCRVLLAVVIAIITVAVTAVPSRAEDRQSVKSIEAKEAGVSYLMLQDGGLVEGKVTSVADWYIVARSGGEMQLAKSRVTFVCSTLEEAYEFRRKQIAESKPEPHLALAEWCLRYGLLSYANHEIAEASKLDSDHPRLALLQRRLETMKSKPAAKLKSVMPPKTQLSDTAQSATQPSMTLNLPDGVVERFTRKVQPILVNSC